MGRLGKGMTLGLLFLAGCVHQPHEPVNVDIPLEIQAAQRMPQAAKNRVHIVFVGSTIDLAGLSHLRAELIDLGFIKTYAGAFATRKDFIALFEETKRREPDARFVVVAQGHGASLGGQLANHLIADGAAVDVVFYLDPFGQPPMPTTRVVCLATRGEGLAGADNYRLEAHGLGAAKHPSAQAVLVRELLEMCGRVRVYDANTTIPGAVARQEWDYLQPAGPCPVVPCAKPILEAAMTPTR